MDLIKSIRKLRILALLLFLMPVTGLLGSLFLHNYILDFKFEKAYNFSFDHDKPGETILVLCDENNNFCANFQAGVVTEFKKVDKLDNCFRHEIYPFFVNSEGIKLKNRNEIDETKNLNEEIYLKYYIEDIIDDSCILNSKQLFFYNIFPFYFNFINEIKFNKKIALGTSETVNPFFKGETSISNIVKRFPINYFFKPSIYLTIIFMLFYWIFYNNIIKKLTGYKNNYYFFIFGILSASFLFLHVFFLGWTFESEFLTRLRRTFIVFFILFEILSQAFLIKKILSIKDDFRRYFNSFIILLKLIFVILICVSSILILSILLFYDLSSKFDYVLEWNYFLILLIFYFLSFLMWKKLTVNPATS